ncbi:MAG TPA: VOC family protein, partial [Candidatus Baltobacteraceae bacterium]|nr:VOC family protein [Candidatus Baltobacteraceae bacterium]
MTTMTSAKANPLAKIDWDYIEFYVGNAQQAAHYYCTAFGFDQVAYAGPETGVKDRVSYVLVQNNLRFVITAALRPDSPITEHVARHGDGVKDIAILVQDARAAFQAALAGGAQAVLAPTEYTDPHGRIVKATISTYGDTVHSFIQRDEYSGVFMPGFQARRKSFPSVQKPGLQFIDHCVGNVGWGEMD